MKNDLHELLNLAGVQIQESGTTIADVTSTVHPVEAVKKDVPSKIKQALRHTVDSHTKQSEEFAAQGRTADARTHNTIASFASEIESMLDGTEEGFKRASTHIHTAQNNYINELPDAVVRYLTGSDVDELIMKHITGDKPAPRTTLKKRVESLR